MGGGHVSTTPNSKTSLRWYVQPVCYRAPTYSHTKDGNRLEGHLNSIITAVKKGHDIRCVSNKDYSFSLNNVALGKHLVAGQNVEHVSKSVVNGRIIFQQDAYWWFTIVTTKGNRDMSRWSVAVRKDRGHTSDRVALDWFDDKCWKHIHTHDASGQSVDGSRYSLILAIQSGSRVRFQISTWGYYTAEADNLSVRNGHVTAQALKHVSKASLEKFQNNAYWWWLMVSTTGTVRATRYNVGGGVHRSNSVHKLQIKWFVDTRPWTRVLSTNQVGSPLSGSKAALVEAIRAGASVRCVHRNGAYAFPAQNLALHGNEVAAQTINSVSMQNVPNSWYEMMIQPRAYWWFTIVDTTGRREMSRWSVGKKISRGHNNDRIAINWFVNK